LRALPDALGLDIGLLVADQRACHLAFRRDRRRVVTRAVEGELGSGVDIELPAALQTPFQGFPGGLDEVVGSRGSRQRWELSKTIAKLVMPAILRWPSRLN
jgi:hypothetical protein